MLSLSFCGWSLLLWLVFPVLAGLSFYGWCFHEGYIVRDNTCFGFFAIFSFCVATVTLLQSLRFFEIFLLYYCSAGGTELYSFLIHCETTSYLNTLPKYTLSEYITELYPIFIHYRTITHPNTLPNYTLSSSITELYPKLVHWVEPNLILLQYRTIPHLNTLPKYTLS